MISEPQKAFSKASSRYDRFAALQKEMGLELLAKIPDKKYQHLLDIGMGTGWLTEQCGKRFSKTKTAGIDYALGMVECAKKRKIDRIVQADAQSLPFKEDTFDLVISNCVYQWVEDIPKAFGETARVLKKEGDFFFTCFGSSTLKELHESIHHCVPKGQGLLHHWRLLSKDNIHQALERVGFKKIAVSSEIKKEKFADFSALLYWLKAIGANRVKRNVFIGPRLLANAKDYYQEHFSVPDGVEASFEIIFGEAHLR
ncbi:MAG: methyltransferase domain-containing protein [Candidatus Omnitrophota bacterium]